jgi:hypothetical protein
MNGLSVSFIRAGPLACTASGSIAANSSSRSNLLSREARRASR